MTTLWLELSCEVEDFVSDYIKDKSIPGVVLLNRARNVGSYGTPPFGTGLLVVPHGADGKLPNQWRHSAGIVCGCCAD